MGECAGGAAGPRGRGSGWPGLAVCLGTSPGRGAVGTRRHPEGGPRDPAPAPLAASARGRQPGGAALGGGGAATGGWGSRACQERAGSARVPALQSAVRAASGGGARDTETSHNFHSHRFPCGRCRRGARSGHLRQVPVSPECRVCAKA